MPTPTCVLFAVLALWAGLDARAEDHASDISVHLSAQPSTGLVPGQPIEFTLNITNHGPEPVNRVTLLSSDFYDQFDLDFGTTDCENFVVIITDGEVFHYNLVWYPADFVALEVGETRVCHFALALSSQAPPIWPFSFGLATIDEDINPANNVSTVILRRGDIPPTALPMISPIISLLLALGLATVACLAISRVQCA
ncbi:MAG: hypothetical protein IPK54_11825 [Dokdonella sp.]|uniref:hypothetical protein n=1 Tax=Dokdonella sp. TaxID=2291710 RepID=UPI0025BDC84B|nr:hypothetical protein [Dokdonella sp.]MBK8124218.1 hypothetical protein [Dokdonella sp.]